MTKGFQKGKFEGIFPAPLLFQLCQGPAFPPGPPRGGKRFPTELPPHPHHVLPNPIARPSTSRGCRRLREPLREGKFPPRFIPGPLGREASEPRLPRPRSGVFRVRQPLSAPSARAGLISQITSRKVPRPPRPSDLPAPIGFQRPPPGPAPTRHSQNPRHAGEILMRGPRCPLLLPPSAISAPKASLRPGDLIRDCRRAWGMLEGKAPWGTPNIHGLVPDSPRHSEHPWVGARYPEHPWIGTRYPKHPWDGAGHPGIPRASMDDDGSIPPPKQTLPKANEASGNLIPPLCPPCSEPATSRARITDPALR